MINSKAIQDYINSKAIQDYIELFSPREGQVIKAISSDPITLSIVLVFVEYLCAISPDLRKDFIDGMMTCPLYVKDENEKKIVN